MEAVDDRLTFEMLRDMARSNSGIYKWPERVTCYNWILGAEVLKAISICGNYYQALEALGVSTTTGAKWRKYAKAGEEPFASFIQLCNQRIAERKEAIEDELEKVCKKTRQLRTGKQ